MRTSVHSGFGKLTLSGSPPRRDLSHPGYVFASIQTTRGCPMNCDFCSVTAFNRAHYRYRPIPEVIGELRTIPQRNVFILDDNIVGNTHDAKERAEVQQTDWFPMTQTVIPGTDNVHAAIYPNPVQDNLMIRANADIKSICVYNSLGVKIQEIATDTKELNVNTSSWNSGMYLVEIKTTNGVTTKKILKR
ncbi:MAG: T9SS type A sorting domain-containing protein [bacterium]